MHRKCPLILTALCFAALPARAQVSISEVCPSYLPDGDVLVLQDEDGDGRVTAVHKSNCRGASQLEPARLTG